MEETSGAAEAATARRGIFSTDVESRWFSAFSEHITLLLFYLAWKLVSYGTVDAVEAGAKMAEHFAPSPIWLLLRIHKLESTTMIPPPALAFVIAGISDAIGAFTSPLPPIGWVADLATALLLFMVLGRQWLLLPGLALEAIPGLGVLPFWLLVVGAIAVLGTPRPRFEWH